MARHDDPGGVGGAAGAKNGIGTVAGRDPDTAIGPKKQPPTPRHSQSARRAPCGRLSFETVRDAARGRWGDILPRLGIPAGALRNRHGPCPGCGGTDRWRWDDRDGRGTYYCGGGGYPSWGDGFGALQHVHGWDASAALRAVAGALGLADGQSAPPPRRAAPAPAPQAETTPAPTREEKIGWAKAVIARSSLSGGEDYFRSRGVTLPLPASVLFASSLKERETGQRLPAIVSVVEHELDGVIGCQRIFLAADRRTKAPVPKPKQSLGVLSGGAVRVTPPAETLWLTEGVEDALSIHQIFGQAAWALVGTSNFGTIMLPPLVHRVILAPDADPAGQATIDKTAERLAAEGREMRVARPPAGRDWNDLLLDFEARAGILEFDAGLGRTEAEAEARRAVMEATRAS